MFGALNDLREPWDRSATNGFRTASYPAGPDAGSDRELALVVRDYAEESPVSDEVFAIYREQFSYDRGELRASVETVDDGSQYWLHERIAFDAAFGFLAYVGLITAAKGIRRLLMRDEDYYD